MTKRVKTRGSPVAEVKDLEAEYPNLAVLAGRFCDELSRQISQLLGSESVALGFPIQHRVKTWASIAEKYERKSLHIRSLKDLDDFVGMRLILQFKRDVETVCSLLEEHFDVLQRYNTEQRLQEDQFGYLSVHLVASVPNTWLNVPTFAGMGDLKAEIQVRTMAQHIWASASHTLQYKKEESVPLPVRRAISRVSALLETVDLEFERVLSERESYRDTIDIKRSTSNLDVDVLEKLLDSLLPPQNKRADNEDYSLLLEDLKEFGITDSGSLLDLYEQYGPKDFQVGEPGELDPFGRRDPVRVNGTPYFHVGFIRAALAAKFGERWLVYLDHVTSTPGT